jgi:hypothetical protein
MCSSSSNRPVVVYDGAVTRADLDLWESELEILLARIGPLFYRRESKKHAEQYVRGLLSPVERKNGWTIAEYVGELEPKALQRFLNLSPWDADAVLDLNREYAMGQLADPGGILIADPTGFAKKGTKSVGVQRQYSGTLGRIDNCQIATFLAYVTGGRDRVLLDRRLYLPEKSWMADPARCAEAGVPPEVVFQTRPEQVREMIESARAWGCRSPGSPRMRSSARTPVYATILKPTGFRMSWPSRRTRNSPTPRETQSSSTPSPNGYVRMHGNAAPAGSDRRDTESMTGHCPTRPNATIST